MNVIIKRTMCLILEINIKNEIFSWFVMNFCKSSNRCHPWQTEELHELLYVSVCFPLISLITGLCVSAAHDTGLVTLQVAVSNHIISNSVVFEYKARALPSLPSSQHDWLSLDGKSSSLSNSAFVGEKITLYHFTKSGIHQVTPDYWATWSRWLYNGTLAQGFSNYPTFSINKLKAHLFEEKSMSWSQR